MIKSSRVDLASRSRCERVSVSRLRVLSAEDRYLNGDVAVPCAAVNGGEAALQHRRHHNLQLLVRDVPLSQRLRDLRAPRDIDIDIDRDTDIDTR